MLCSKNGFKLFYEKLYNSSFAPTNSYEASLAEQVLDSFFKKAKYVHSGFGRHRAERAQN